MTATTTSRLAFHQTTAEREVQQEMLYRLYERRGATSDREAAAHLGWYPSQVSARRNALVAEGRVVDLGKQKDQNTGKLVSVWGPVNDRLFA